jgi:hypothetical protein
MQEHDVAAPGQGQRIEHRVRPHRVGRRVEIGIASRLQADRPHDRRVIGPGRRAQPHPGIGLGPPDQLGQHPHGTRAARRLHRPDAILRRVAEHQGRHAGVEPIVAGKVEIALGRLGLEQPALGVAHGGHDRRAPLAIVVDADAEVDLVRPRVGSDRSHDRVDGVRRCGLEGLEHRAPPAWSMKVLVRRSG